jgi:hypothetical protein
LQRSPQISKDFFFGRENTVRNCATGKQRSGVLQKTLRNGVSVLYTTCEEETLRPWTSGIFKDFNEVHSTLVEFSSVIIRVHHAPNIDKVHLTRVKLNSVIIHPKRSFAENPRHQRKLTIMADRTEPSDRSAPWYQNATSAEFIGIPVNVDEKLNPIHLNTYANEWASADEPGLYGKALLGDFQEIFHGWDPGVFNLFNKIIRGYVKARLRINGIYIDSGSIYPLKRTFADFLDLKEPPIWPEDELRNAMLNLKGFICSQKIRFTAEEITNNPEFNSSPSFNTRYL